MKLRRRGKRGGKPCHYERRRGSEHAEEEDNGNGSLIDDREVELTATTTTTVLEVDDDDDAVAETPPDPTILQPLGDPPATATESATPSTPTLPAPDEISEKIIGTYLLPDSSPLAFSPLRSHRLTIDDPDLGLTSDGRSFQYLIRNLETYIPDLLLLPDIHPTTGKGGGVVTLGGEMGMQMEIHAIIKLDLEHISDTVGMLVPLSEALGEMPGLKVFYDVFKKIPEGVLEDRLRGME